MLCKTHMVWDPLKSSTTLVPSKHVQAASQEADEGASRESSNALVLTGLHVLKRHS